MKASHDRIQYLTPINDAFEKSYIALRKKEGYLLSVEEIKQLPVATINRQNWELRGQTAKRFIKYISAKRSSLVVLDLGCGNGWFSNYLAQCPNVEKVYGCDINQFELQLAAKSFPNEKLTWLYADIFKAQVPQSFDIIVLNSSVQYFPDLTALITHLKTLLKPGGEIHILDSPFYKSVEFQKKATERSFNYYTALGFPDMAIHYTPHLFHELHQFRAKCLYRPSFISLLARKLKLSSQAINPFYWFKIGS